MPELEMNVSMLKCPICDLNHSYKVKVEYSEMKGPSSVDAPIYYNTFVTEKKVADKVVQVNVFEIDAFCLKNGIPFRIIVDPVLPAGTWPTKFTVTSAT
ncbi:MAG: hypothetical protein AMDU3_IPLC00001G0064 [Thermoplasmatales archaeon I-plasma]|jgi:hypothetical protein|nr:MAG: hypothetical protein AMDU3_IPLC00001G0064 [Thermoplasmatales archaeon I-plasma]MCL5929910.1 hypothetical protein [Candidatus Thermoplasmatota archaeon]